MITHGGGGGGGEKGLVEGKVASGNRKYLKIFLC